MKKKQKEDVEEVAESEIVGTSSGEFNRDTERAELLKIGDNERMEWVVDCRMVSSDAIAKQYDYIQKAEIAKTAKKAYEAALDDLLAISTSPPRKETLPLFDDGQNDEEDD